MRKEHIREILSATDGAASDRDADIVASWRRCLDDHRLDPEVSSEARIVPAERLKLHRQESEQFLRKARFGLEDLYRRVNGMGYVLLLTDATGVVVDSIGDEKVDWELKRAGLYLGAEWTEHNSGTNGVGACLATGEPIVVHQSDHFDVAHCALSCTAAPIYDVLGNLLGVLDISLLQSPKEKTSQALALEVVKSCVRRIELANLMSTFSANWIVRMSPSPEFLDVDPNCAFAVAADGTIAGMTNGAQRVLAGAAATDWKDPTKLIGQPFNAFFEMDVNDLPQLTRGTASEDRTLVTRSGDIAFAHAIMPSPAVRKRRAAERPIPEPLRKIHGGDPALQVLCEKAARLVEAHVSIILRGETGVGKEFIAKALHESRRRKGSFIAVNCAALPETLIESELFGYAPGAFTGALAKGKAGLIEKADGGTLFLDEIGDMPMVLQARLLRVLAEREVTRVGATTPTPIDIRVVSASHRDLGELVRSGQFRQDLYYRLNGVVLDIPPVRRRRDLNWLLTQIFQLNWNGEAHLTVDDDAKQALLRYDWPGNVREITNVVELCVALCDDGHVRIDHLPDCVANPASAEAADPDGDADAPNWSEHGPMVELLSSNEWNVSAAARIIGIDRSTLHRRMKKLGIVAPNKRRRFDGGA